MRHFRYFLIIAFSLFSLQNFGQGVIDALRYSLFEVGGTARTVGVGGGMGALGTDFSVMSTNPAGLAWYRSSEFMVTPALYLSTADAELLNDLNGSTANENKFNFNFNNLGVVIASRPLNPKWTTSNFAIGLNRLANFHQSFFFQGESTGSIVERFRDLANGANTLDAFEAGVAAGAEAILFDENSGFYFSDFDPVPDALIQREQLVTTSGSINEVVFSYAGNFKERFMIGVTLGIPFVNFTEEKTYRESDNADNVEFFDDLEFTERLTASGTGINLKIGMIFRLHQNFRVGAAVHTPTTYRLTDNFTTSLTYNFTEDNVPNSGSANSPNDTDFEYQLTTPWRFIGSAAVLLKRYGFISGEVEWVNYGSAKFGFDDFPQDEADANMEISDVLTSALNIRLGGELAYQRYRFRAGFGLQQSPFESVDRVNPSFSLGLGFREQAFYIDFAYRYSNQEDTYFPYQPIDTFSDQPEVQIESARNRILITAGVKF